MGVGFIIGSINLVQLVITINSDAIAMSRILNHYNTQLFFCQFVFISPLVSASSSNCSSSSGFSNYPCASAKAILGVLNVNPYSISLGPWRRQSLQKINSGPINLSNYKISTRNARKHRGLLLILSQARLKQRSLSNGSSNWRLLSQRCLAPSVYLTVS